MVEIDAAHLDMALLRPDEDFMTQSLLPINLTAVDDAYGLAVHREMRARVGDFAGQGTILPETITRVALFDPKTVPEMVYAMADASITILGHLTYGSQFAAWTRWLFDGPDAVRVAEFDPMMTAIEGRDDNDVPAGLREFARRQEERLRPILDRWDVEVYANPNYRGRSIPAERASPD